MQFQFAKAAAERDMLFGCEFLITEKHHFVFMPRIHNLLEGGVVYFFRQIDAEDFRAERGTGGANIENVSQFRVSKWLLMNPRAL